MAKPGDLKWDDFFKSNEPKSNLQKTRTEKVPSAQYHQDKPVGTLHKNAFSDQGKVSKTPAAPINKPGEVPRKPTNIEISQSILASIPKQMRQPTNAEMQAAARQMGLVKSEEELAQLQKDWENRLNDFHNEANKPVEPQLSKTDEAWASGKSFNDTLTEEERSERNKFVSGNENE